MSNKDIFNNIYQNGVWQNVEGLTNVPLSGPGSIPEYNPDWIAYVNQKIADPTVSSILDLGCGDFTLCKNLNLVNKTYTGVDVSDYIINYSTQFKQSNMTLVCDDIVTMDLPPADLIIMKDVLIHLSNEEISSVLNKVEAACKYAILTEDSIDAQDNSNSEIVTGQYRSLDLQADPFNKTSYTVVEEYVVGNSATKKKIYFYAKP